MHPLLNLAATRPRLLMDHAAAYAQLVGAEWEGVGSRLQRRLVWGVAALLLAALTLVLAGVACLLGAALPLAQMPAPWALWAVPLATALAAAACAWARQSAQAVQPFARLRLQLQADLALWQELDVK